MCHLVQFHWHLGNKNVYDIQVIAICQNHPSQMFWSIIETNMMWLYQYIDCTISNQWYQHIYMCDDLITFVLLYHASQLRATYVNTICQNPPPNPMFWLVIKTYMIGLYRYVERPAEHYQIIVSTHRKCIVMFRTCITPCYVHHYPNHDTFWL